MLPTIDLGPVVLPTAGLVLILGVWLMLTTVEKAAARLGLHVPTTYTVAVIGLATAAVAARVVFVAQHWQAYSQHPLSIVWPLTTGFNSWAGVLAGVAAAFFYGRARQLPAWRTLDALAPALAVGLITWSLSDFLAGPGYGIRTEVPWRLTLFGVGRHPVQLYEILVGLLALLAWWLVTRRSSLPGQPFLISGAVYSGGRLFTDAFRANPWLTDSGYHIVQIISLAVLLLSLLLLMQLSQREPEGTPLVTSVPQD